MSIRWIAMLVSPSSACSRYRPLIPPGRSHCHDFDILWATNRSGGITTLVSSMVERSMPGMSNCLLSASAPRQASAGIALSAEDGLPPSARPLQTLMTKLDVTLVEPALGTETAGQRRP
ncbi:hypothetical protein ACFWII_11000 [Streptomyces sp. NPDC127063]|uniref:hypothetical protein n=1 Tax=Streptomyces sp. NPDC127063 TaxID=3347123 RepID=UPI0036466E0A